MKFSFLSAVAFSICLSIPAGATQVSVSSGLTSPVAGTTTTFGGGMPSNFTASGPESGIYTGSLLDVYLAPSGDPNAYFAVGPNSWLNINYSSAPITSFGLYWGSLDTYNSIAFTDTNGVTTTYGGAGISLASVLPSSLALNGTMSSYVTFTDQGAAWTSVYITSSVPAFEFDNVTTSSTSSTPEPASIALLATGLLAVGAGALRGRNRRK